MAQSLFKLLKRREPPPPIHVLAPAWTRPLLARMPEVEEAIEMPVGHGRLGLSRRLRLARRLRAHGYAQAILLPNSWKSALVPFWARIPRRTGWLGELRYGLLNDIRRLDKRALPTTVQRFAALGAEPGAAPPPVLAPRLEIKVEDARRALGQLGLKKRARRPVLALCPGAEFGPAKRWPAAFFGQLARSLRDRDWDVWLFGSDNDRSVCSDVNGFAAGVCVDLSGRTSLAQAVDLMSVVDRVVSNDSGLMHIAAALDRPLVAIFGSTDPGHTPPLSRRAQVLSLGLDCSPCFKRECPLGHMDCLRRLSVDRVQAALESLSN
jgi:heptosyltransferase-2